MARTVTDTAMGESAKDRQKRLAGGQMPKSATGPQPAQRANKPNRRSRRQALAREALQKRMGGLASAADSATTTATTATRPEFKGDQYERIVPDQVMGYEPRPYSEIKESPYRHGTAFEDISERKNQEAEYRAKDVYAGTDEEDYQLPPEEAGPAAASEELFGMLSHSSGPKDFYFTNMPQDAQTVIAEDIGVDPAELGQMGWVLDDLGPQAKALLAQFAQQSKMENQIRESAIQQQGMGMMAGPAQAVGVGGAMGAMGYNDPAVWESIPPAPQPPRQPAPRPSPAMVQQPVPQPAPRPAPQPMAPTPLRMPGRPGPMR